MKDDVLVSVKGVSKKFCKDLKTSLKYGLVDSLKAIVNKSTSEKEKLRDKEFWAVKDISFELKRGECIGLIGHNGAGKSTLLKVINGLIKPDSGRIELKGKIGALIELGAGFNSILTGRENIYNNAAILGFSKKEIDEKLDDIIAFSEIEEFIDTPVQNYSSGMKVRLGFAVAAHLEPDILIIDEVLAVGDLGFVLKCFKTIDQLLPNTAVIFVSHNMPMVSRICNKIILMDKGKEVYNGPDVSKGIDLYYNRFSNNKRNIIFDDGRLEVLGIKINNSIDDVYLNWGEDFLLEFSYLNKELSNLPYFKFSIFDKEQRAVAIFNYNVTSHNIKTGVNNIKIKHNDLQLSKGIYSINVAIFEVEERNPIIRVNQLIQFQIKHEKETWPPFLLASQMIN